MIGMLNGPYITFWQVGHIPTGHLGFGPPTLRASLWAVAVAVINELPLGLQSLRRFDSYSSRRRLSAATMKTYKLGTAGDRIVTVKKCTEGRVVTIRAKDDENKSVELPPKRQVFCLFSCSSRAISFKFTSHSTTRLYLTLSVRVFALQMGGISSEHRRHKHQRQGRGGG